MPQLTDTAIRAAKPAEASFTLWDTSLKGFGLRVYPGGAKTFIVLIGPGRRQSIGRYPTLSLSDARGEARRILAEKTLGKVRPRHTPYEDARDEFLKDCESRLRPFTVKLYKRHLSGHFPLKRKSVGDISPTEIIRLLNRIKAPSEKEHAARVGRTFFRWCVGQHLIERSPMETLPSPPASKSRERVLTEDELRAVYKTALKAKSGFQRLILLLIHTGGRRTETTRLEWPAIGPDTLTFRGETRKVRKSEERDHTIPIGPRLRALLITFPRLDDTPYVFPAARTHVKGQPTTVMTGYSKMKRDFDKECGVTGWTPHDLRRTMVTVMCEKLDVLPHVADWIIAHVSGKPSGAARVYNRAVYMRQAREAIELWERYLSSLAETP